MAEATIRDVARRAQVSVASVSRVLNRFTNVSDDTRARVTAAVDELGYVPHAGARSLSLARTGAIGVVLPNLHGEFFSEIVRGMDRLAADRGYLLLLSNMHAQTGEAQAVLKAMRGRVDGLIVMAPHLEDAGFATALPRGTPAVLVNTRAEIRDRPAIRLDNAAGARSVAEHLIATGRKRIVHISGPMGNIDAEERADAFRQAMDQHNDIQSVIIQGDFYEESGAAAVAALIETDQKFDAIFAANDMMAIGALEALRDRGMKVPEEVAVAGFDDVPLASHLRLTTVQVHIAELGERAIERLVRMLEGEEDRIGEELHAPELVVRGSTVAGNPLIEVDRRQLLAGSSLLLGGAILPGMALAQPGPRRLPDFYEDIEHRTFRFFWDTVNRANGLVPDRWPTPSFSSIAAVGFALTAYPIAVERGWCARADARDLTLTTLRFFWNAPQGSEPRGTSGHKGFFYHFLDMENGVRFRDVELSSVDTTMLLLGVLFAGQYYERADPAEVEIRDLAQKLYARADWNVFRSDGRKAISMGWHPESGLIDANWVGYNEGMMVNILALGAPVHSLPPEVWTEWTKPYPKFWRGEGPTRRLAFAPLCMHQYSQTWIDFRGIRDAPMRAAGFDYFENSRRETYANRAWCIANPMQWDGYSKDVWGLSACDGPGGRPRQFKGRMRSFFGYAARGPESDPDGRDDGTIAPTAALGSLPFAPEIVIPCAEALLKQSGIFRKYGFADSFNPSFRFADAKVESGTVDPRRGWVATDYLGIDQGPILLQAANYRDDFVWRYMRRVPAIRRGLKRAGFTGGWLG